MKYLVLVAMLIAAFAQQPTKAPEGKRASKPDSAQVTNQGDTDEAQQEPAPSSTSIPQTANPSVKAHDEDLKIQRKLVWFTGLLVIVGFLQAGVMALQWLMYRRQANEMRRQRHEMKRQRRYMRLQWKAMGEQAKLTAGQVAEMKEQTDVLGKSVKATQDNAAAAKANADALINSERAWVIAELRHNARQDKAGRWYHEDGVPFTVAEVLAGNHLLYRLRITNMGRTPAHIFSFEIRYACLLEGVKDLPENPPTQKADFHEFIHLLTPGKTFEILDDINVEQYMRGDWDNVTRLEKTAVFYGCVKYRHMFSTENDNPQSDFCYVYTVDLSRLSSVGRHTRYT